MPDETGEKTIKATPRKRDESKKEGDLPRAREFANLLSFVLVVMFFGVFAVYGVVKLSSIFKNHLANLDKLQVNQATIQRILGDLAGEVGLLILPFFIFLLVTSFFLNIVFQGGFAFTAKPFRFQPNKFNPVKGLQRLFFSKNAVANFVRSILIVAIIIAISIQSLMEVFPQLYTLQMMPLDRALMFTFTFIFFSLWPVGFRGNPFIQHAGYKSYL